MTFKLFAACAPGLEPFAEQELRGLGLADLRRVPGGVAFAGDLRDIYRANYLLRTVSRLLVRLGEFHAEEFWELEKRAARLEWERYLKPGQPVVVRATSHKSRLYHSDAVAERIAKAIGERLGQPVTHQTARDDEAEAATAPVVVVRLDHDTCLVSLDSSGELLHRRGYRLATAKAPLRETLAAGMLLAARWDGVAPLIDPFCGAGTLVIEAALRALDLPPGRGRRFAFMDWPAFDASLWDEVARRGPAPPPGRTLPLIIASDRDEGALEAARANARRAGVAEHIAFLWRAVSELEAPARPGWVVTNPPYGVRVGEAADRGGRGRPRAGASPLRHLYAAFGDVLRKQCPAWQVAFLCPDPGLAFATGLSFDKARSVRLINGGLMVTLWQAQVPALPPPG